MDWRRGSGDFERWWKGAGKIADAAGWKNPLKNVGNPGVDGTWRETRKQIDELEVRLQDHYFRLKTLWRILKQRTSLLSGLANPTSEHHESAQQMLRDFVGTAVKVEEFAGEIQELRRTKRAELDMS